MRFQQLSRRTFLAGSGAIALGSLGFARATSSTSSSRTSFKILEGTKFETTVYETTAQTEGPTVMVVGGVHGNEEAGYLAAEEIAKWEIESGTLVTLPRADKPAIRHDTRAGPNGIDLNRQFPVGSEPETKLARAIWNVVLRYDPDAVIDLHESRTLYRAPGDGVGQTIFHSDDQEAAKDAADAATYVNNTLISDPTYRFGTGEFSGPKMKPNGLLVHKAARDTDALSYLAETVSVGFDIETRVTWHTEVVRQLTGEELFVEGAPEAEAAPNEPPTAVIRTTPEDAGSTNLDEGTTVVLDASSSTDPDGEIVTFEWDVDGDRQFEETGKTVEIPMKFCGTLSVTLRVVDDDGATDTERITLSTI